MPRRWMKSCAWAAMAVRSVRPSRRRSRCFWLMAAGHLRRRGLGIRLPPRRRWPQGHSTFSAAAAAVLDTVFGTNVGFTDQADPHDGFRERPLADQQVQTRSFTSFDQAAAEAGESRIYGGIHYQFDNVEGQAAGRAI